MTTPGGEHEDGNTNREIEGQLHCVPSMKSETEPLQDRVVACVGGWYLRLLHASYTEGGEPGVLLDVSDTVDEDEDECEIEFEDDIEFLRSLDPKDWKNQDHYAVLGLGKLRIKATDDDIKKAYRLKVLKHHPDKRRAAGEHISQDDDYFTCITKAWEMLGTPLARRAFDSVDPEFDDEVPTANEASKDGFYETFAPVFERNAIWSENTPVPVLGNDNASRETVEKFYAFWFNFVSWREFSYNDDEEAKTGQDRDTRKWVEKQNKTARAKLKKEEMARIRRLVETAYECDPRVQRFRQQDRDSKIALKQARQNAIQAKREEEEKARQAALEQERLAKEEKEREERQAQEVQRKQREAAKNALRKEKKALRTLCKENNYFATASEESVNNMVKMESICDVFSLEKLAEVTRSLQGLSLEEGAKKFAMWAAELDSRLEKERAQVMEFAVKGSGSKTKAGSGAEWSPEDLQLLIKAVNLFPAGTNQRWEVVAQFVNQHSASKEIQRSAKEVLAKTKGLQSSDYSSLKDAANKKAFEDFAKGQRGSVATVADSEASQRFDSPAEQQGYSSPWTAPEQQLLEQALRTYPANTLERWDRIAECIPNRSKKECMRRFKELAEIVKAKKAAQAKVKTGTK
ncbi:hypothetical protein B566_EDAN004946 [Ephemera danica]|nr:hypothetical protein B566_EDAN004946 [Ephemera danica]